MTMDEYIEQMVERHARPLTDAIRANLAHRPTVEQDKACQWAESQLRESWRREFELAQRHNR